MYEKFASSQGWRWEVLSEQRSELGGIKEAAASVSGSMVYRKLKVRKLSEWQSIIGM
jgi:peptide chain release factor 1